MSETLAYLAGAMDSDGHFSIKQSTYHMRVRKDAGNPVYSELIGLKQITPDVPDLLRQNFGGHTGIGKAQTPNSRPLFRYSGTDRVAANACAALLPYLRIKRRQASLLLELRESKKAGYGQASYWFAKDFPDWQNGRLVTTSEAAKILGYKSILSVSQAVQNGSLLALPPKNREYPRIPYDLLERIKEIQGNDGRSTRLPPQLVAWRERLWKEAKELNKIGVHGTDVYHRTGAYAPA